jgi:glycine/D-amino acid oxidase-like deaminating enzyme
LENGSHFFIDRAPWIKSNWNFGKYYVIPNTDTVVVGGTAQRGNSSTDYSSEDNEDILANIARLYPDIRDAPVVSGMMQHVFG